MTNTDYLACESDISVNVLMDQLCCSNVPFDVDVLNYLFFFVCFEYIHVRVEQIVIYCTINLY